MFGLCQPKAATIRQLLHEDGEPLFESLSPQQGLESRLHFRRQLDTLKIVCR
jgi:hypothetical protein